MFRHPHLRAGRQRHVKADRRRSFSFSHSSGNRRKLGFETLEDRQLLAATTIDLYAAGTTGTENMILTIDDAIVATFTNVGGDAFNRVFEHFSYTHPTAVSANQVRVNFANDAVVPEGNRDLRVDRIEIGGVRYESEAPSTFSLGAWSDENGCGPGNKQTEFLACNGWFRYADGGSVIEVFAAGETNEETMELQIDGVTVATFDNVGGDAANGVFDNYRYTHDGLLSIDQVRVAFTNNGVATGGGDRNLRVDRMTLDGFNYESEGPGVFSVGSFVPGIGCTSGNNQTETLYCDGYFEYAQASVGSTFQIFAAGETNEETMELQIDGATVATFDNVGGDAANGVFATFSYTHPTAVTIDRVRVAFTNNGVASGGGDRNLRVDRITLDGTNFETEAADTFSVGSYVPGIGCTSGTLQTDILYCDGYFEYQASTNPGTLALGTTAVSVNEQDGTVSIPVIRTGGSDGAVSLNYTTVDASATAGNDYTLTAGQAFSCRDKRPFSLSCRF